MADWQDAIRLQNSGGKNVLIDLLAKNESTFQPEEMRGMLLPSYLRRGTNILAFLLFQFLLLLLYKIILTFLRVFKSDLYCSYLFLFLSFFSIRFSCSRTWFFSQSKTSAELETFYINQRWQTRVNSFIDTIQYSGTNRWQLSIRCAKIINFSLV